MLADAGSSIPWWLVQLVIWVVLGLVVALLVVSLRARGAARGPAAGFVPAGAPPSRPPAVGAPQPANPPSAPRFELVARKHLPTFEDVGGMDALKQEMRDTVELVLAHPERAAEYGITWNGLLLHGPPGVGKSFFARALAGELGMSLIPISTSDLVSPIAGSSPKLVEDVFAFASAHMPCVLFFDELDAVAEARGQANPDPSARDVLLQLLQSLEEHRDEFRLLVVAATNDIDALDPAVVRPGRFDRHVRIDLPDAAAREAIFATHLADRPVEKRLDLATLAKRTNGRTPAALAQACEVAAFAAFRQSIGTDQTVRIGNEHLLRALEHGAGEDRPTVEDWHWNRLILPERTRRELQQLQLLIQDPEQSGQLGVEPPSGVLLTGPPGTGKTTVAKVLAAEARCSFYPVSAADVTSRWVGESEQKVARLFRRARDNAPSIVFIDEIDAIGAARGQLGTYDRQLDQLLQEIDGMGPRRAVLVIGATNRPGAIDPALLRGGRLSRVIHIPLPDADSRLAILRLHTERMPLSGVDLDELALETEGFSGADLKALCQQAAVEAMVRRSANTRAVSAVTDADFHAALGTAHTNGQPGGAPRRRRRS